MPLRSDDSLRVGLCSMVRARMASKLGKVCGPSTKSMMACALRRFTPGVMSTRTRRRTSSGQRAANTVAVMPPSDIPTTASAWGASRSTPCATASARLSGL